MNRRLGFAAAAHNLLELDAIGEVDVTEYVKHADFVEELLVFLVRSISYWNYWFTQSKSITNLKKDVEIHRGNIGYY